jgi:hypothetical protein
MSSFPGPEERADAGNHLRIPSGIGQEVVEHFLAEPITVARCAAVELCPCHKETLRCRAYSTFRALPLSSLTQILYHRYLGFNLRRLFGQLLRRRRFGRH